LPPDFKAMDLTILDGDRVKKVEWLVASDMAEESGQIHVAASARLAVELLKDRDAT